MDNTCHKSGARAELPCINCDCPRQPADDEWDQNAEHMTQEAGVGGGPINMDATDIADLFEVPNEQK